MVDLINKLDTINIIIMYIIFQKDPILNDDYSEIGINFHKKVHLVIKINILLK